MLAGSLCDAMSNKRRLLLLKHAPEYIIGRVILISINTGASVAVATAAAAPNTGISGLKHDAPEYRRRQPDRQNIYKTMFYKSSHWNIHVPYRDDRWSAKWGTRSLCATPQMSSLFMRMHVRAVQALDVCRVQHHLDWHSHCVCVWVWDVHIESCKCSAWWMTALLHVVRSHTVVPDDTSESSTTTTTTTTTTTAIEQKAFGNIFVMG